MNAIALLFVASIYVPAVAILAGALALALPRKRARGQAASTVAISAR